MFTVSGLVTLAAALRFSPAAIAIPSGVAVRFVLANESRVDHDFVIPALGRRTPRIGPGETAESLILAEPGAYDFNCSIQDHQQAGMGGVITAR